MNFGGHSPVHSCLSGLQLSPQLGGLLGPALPYSLEPQLTHLFSFFRESAVISAQLLLMTLTRGPYIF